MLEIQVEVDEKTLPDLSKGDVSKLTRSVAARVRDALRKATPVDSGGTKRSWTGVLKTEGGYSFQNISPAATTLEFGSASGKRPWPSVGPRTVYNQGRIYSSQAPEGMTKKANARQVAQKVTNELLVKLVSGKSLKK